MCGPATTRPRRQRTTDAEPSASSSSLPLAWGCGGADEGGGSRLMRQTAEPQRLVEDLTLQLPLHYPIPDARAYRVLADRTYRTVSGHAYPLDVYQPARLEKDAERPAVVLVHGQAHPARLREAKAW